VRSNGALCKDCCVQYTDMLNAVKRNIQFTDDASLLGYRAMKSWRRRPLLQRRYALTHAYFYETTWHHIPEGCHLHICHRENIKSHILKTIYIKLSHYHHADDKGESKHSSYSLLTLTLDGVSGQHYTLAAPYHWYPLVRRLGGPQRWSRHRS
jgi:hypothetical protein